MPDPERSCLIVGAGISGLLAANILKKHDIQTTILEKSRGVGGRMATRRIGGSRADHGAQYFTVRHNIFGGWVESWENQGLVKEWFRRFPEESSEVGHTRFCGREGMTDVPKYLAEGLDIRLETKVSKIQYKDSHWYAHSEGGEVFDAKFLLLTAPAPQSLLLLKESNIVLRRQKLDALQAIRYEPTLTVMAVLDGPSGISEPGAHKIHEEPLSWIADNQRKGVSGDVPILTIHSTHNFAREHYDEDREVTGRQLLEAARPHFESEVVEFQCHGWKYALPYSPFESHYFLSRRHALMMAGDAFGGGRVESAALSGIEAAAHLVDFF